MNNNFFRLAEIYMAMDQKRIKRTFEMKEFFLWNFGFFGGQREGHLAIDGQLKIITDGEVFQVEKIGGWGGLQWYPGVSEFPKLDDNVYRCIHDAAKKEMKKKHAVSDVVKFSDTAPVYRLMEGFISKNVQVGDVVLDLFTNKTALVESSDDISYYNWHLNFKIVNREVEHPAPMSRKEFLEKLSSKDPFEDWQIVDCVPKDAEPYFTLLVDGTTYPCWSDWRRGFYYIEHQNTTYARRSNISAPFFDAVDLLSGFTFSEYKDGRRTERTVFDVQRLNDTFYRSRLFNEMESYHYDNAAIKLELK